MFDNIDNLKVHFGNFKTFKVINKKPFGKLEIDFLNSLSENIFNNREAKKYSDIISYGFWIRKENLNKIKKKYHIEENKIGLGNIFHISPSNVPINFAYSFTIGMLTGNSNMIRLPSKNFDQIKLFFKILKKLSSKKKFKEILTRNIFFQYDSTNDLITKKLSMISDGRIVWGGDETSKKLRFTETKARTKDIFLTDRYSFSLIVSKEFNKLKNNKLSSFINNFYNDAFFMDQNACTSPHLIVWKGMKKDNIKAQEIFWKNLADITKKKYSLDLFYSVKKFNDICDDILIHDNLEKYNNYENLIYRVKIKKLKKNLSELRKSFGYFYEYEINNLNKIKYFFDEKIQTITYYGLNKKILLKFVYENKIRGIDRIVPVGLAHEMSFFWDGYDLETHMTRKIDAK